MLDLEFAQLSDAGRERANNEDSLGYSAPAQAVSGAASTGWLFVLADGVGGQADGEVASRQAVERTLAGFRAAPEDELFTALIPRLVQSANSAVFAMANSVGGPRSMATTLVACGLRYDSAVISHVGDSRCYLLRAGAATPLTRDHTLANEHVKLGIVSPREARSSSNHQMLTRSLGQELIANIDTSEHRLTPGDVLILCSDGLHASVGEPAIARLLERHPDLPRAAAELVSLANSLDGSDNISVQLIRIRAVERVGMYRGRPYKLR